MKYNLISPTRFKILAIKAVIDTGSVVSGMKDVDRGMGGQAHKHPQFLQRMYKCEGI